MEESSCTKLLDCKAHLQSKIVKKEQAICDNILGEVPYLEYKEMSMEEEKSELVNFDSTMEESTNTELLDCKEHLQSKIVKEEKTPCDKLLEGGFYQNEFECRVEVTANEEKSESANFDSTMQEVANTELLDCKEHLQSKLIKGEQTICDKTLEGGPCQDEIGYMVEVSLEEGNLEGALNCGLSPSKIYRCSECNYECKYMSNLKRHMLTHSDTNQFRCSDCDYECKTKSLLMQHMLTHLKTKQFRCSDCNYESNRKCHLKQHMLTHSDVKKFRCLDCNYECNLKRCLQQHMLSHSNIKLFRCSNCDYECNRKCELKRHMLTHSNIKEFKCLDCEFECKRKSELKRHCQRVHPNENPI